MDDPRLIAALRVRDAGFALLPLKPRSKVPYSELLPRDERGEPSWKPFWVGKESVS